MTQKTSIKNDGFNNEVKNGTITIDGSACLESGVKFETTVDQTDFVDFSITGGATACIETNGENTPQGFAIDINARPPAFIFAVKATMNGIDLINYNKKVGFSEPIPILKDFIF